MKARDVIGEGTYGRVEPHPTSSHHVIKYYTGVETDDAIHHTTLRELNFLSRLFFCPEWSHDSLLPPTAICCKELPQDVLLFTFQVTLPRLPKTLLHWSMQSTMASRVKTLPRVWDQLLSVLEFVHTRGIVHRDIKPNNILVECSDSVNLRPVLIDWGSLLWMHRPVVSDTFIDRSILTWIEKAVPHEWLEHLTKCYGKHELMYLKLRQTYHCESQWFRARAPRLVTRNAPRRDDLDVHSFFPTSDRTTFIYAPPEVERTSASDVYSLGCTLIQFLTDQCPDLTIVKPCPQVWKKMVEEDCLNVPAPVRALLLEMIRSNPTQRPTCKSLRQSLRDPALYGSQLPEWPCSPPDVHMSDSSQVLCTPPARDRMHDYLSRVTRMTQEADEQKLDGLVWEHVVALEYIWNLPESFCEHIHQFTKRVLKITDWRWCLTDTLYVACLATVCVQLVLKSLSSNVLEVDLFYKCYFKHIDVEHISAGLYRLMEVNVLERMQYQVLLY